MRRVKKPNLDGLLGLGAEVGSVCDRRFSISGVLPRVGTRDGGANPEVRLGLGDGLRDEDLEGMPNLLLLLVETDPNDGVRLCDDGKLDMLLWITGDGPRRPIISKVPSLLGLEGLLPAGESARCASSGGACMRGFSVAVSDGRRVGAGFPFCRVDDTRPCSSGVISLATGGLPDKGLTCRMRTAGLLGSETPGE